MARPQPIEVTRRQRLAAACLPVAPVDEHDIETPIVVQIDECTTCTHGLGQIFLAGAPVVMRERDAGRRRHVGERHRERRGRRAERGCCDRRNQRQRDRTESLHSASVVGGSGRRVHARVA